MYIIYVNHDSVIQQICQLRGNAYSINETLATLHINPGLSSIVGSTFGGVHKRSGNEIVSFLLNCSLSSYASKISHDQRFLVTKYAIRYAQVV